MLALQIATGFGIAVIFPLLIYYGVSTFHPAPKRTHYFRVETTGTVPTADERRASQAAFNAAAEAFSRVLIVVATLLGIGAIFAGAVIGIHFIGTGLILGGVASIAFGYWSYWGFLKDWMRFASLLVGFVMLLIVGIRWFSGT